MSAISLRPIESFSTDGDVSDGVPEFLTDEQKKVYFQMHQPKRHLFPALLFKNMEFVTQTTGNSQLFKATRRQDNRVVAIKKLPLKNVHERVAALNVNEAHMSQIMASCPGVVRCLHCYRSKDHLWLVMDWIDGAMLRTLLSLVPFTQRHIAYVARHVLLSLEWMHARGIVHRDIKSTNIMVDRDLGLRVIDFGYTFMHTQEQDVCTDTAGTLLFMAPEVLAGTGHRMAADIWSLGVLVYELLCGDPPHGDLPLDEVARRVRMGAVPPLPAPVAGTPAGKFVMRCLERYQGRRPTASQLLADPLMELAPSHSEWAASITAVLPDWPVLPDPRVA